MQRACGLHVFITEIMDGRGFPSCGTWGCNHVGTRFLRFKASEEDNSAAFDAPQQIYRP